jgi:hypothetical protein
MHLWYASLIYMHVVRITHTCIHTALSSKDKKESTTKQNTECFTQQQQSHVPTLRCGSVTMLCPQPIRFGTLS